MLPWLKDALGETIGVSCNRNRDPSCTLIGPGQLEAALLNLALNAQRYRIPLRIAASL